MHLYIALILLGTALLSPDICTAEAQRNKPADRGGLSVVQVSPLARQITAATDSAIVLQFDRAIDSGSVTLDTLRVFGRWSGAAEGAISLIDADTTVVFAPEHRFSAGEQVMVVLSDQISAQDGTALTAGYSFQFWTATQSNPLSFETIDTLTTRTVPQQTSRAYGGAGTDLNNDGWLDISIINEDTADVRVFMNKADGTGLYDTFMADTTPVNDRASPNESADFNNDGNADLVVGNINTSSLSILLGNGDGTFAPQQEVTVGGDPRGVAVLDIDADGDLDIANTNAAGAGSVSLLVNDGAGVFSAATFFEGGGQGEWALGAGDMNEDGQLDLVMTAFVGGIPSVIVHANNGDGSFTQLSSRAVNGSPWMLNIGDLDGDGHEDVAVVNSVSNQGSILLGKGNGTLDPPTHYPTDPFPLATDLGDIDGDGDLDWVTSSFSGDWFLFLNDGAGSFGLRKRFPAPLAASCALMLDINNDHVLDLALIDELADELRLVKTQRDTDGDGVVDVADNCSDITNADQRDSNGDGFGNLCDGDLTNDGATNFADLAEMKTVFFCVSAEPACADADLDGDGTVNFIDLGIMKSLFFQPPGPASAEID